MNREEMLIIARRIHNRLEHMRMSEPSLFQNGPLSHLFEKCRKENEDDFIALYEASQKDTMEGLVLRLIAHFEKKALQESHDMEERILRLESEAGDLKSQLQEVKNENAKRMVLLASARSHIGQIIKEFDSLNKNSNKVLTALKIVCDILEEGMEEPMTPPRYRYNIEVIKIAILTIVHARCSFRSAVGVLEIFQKYLPFLFPDGDTPAYTTVRYWVIKSGLALIPKLKKRVSGRYFLIVDESIVLNKQKMLVILAAPLKRKNGHGLSFREVSIALMEVRDSWKGEEIADRLEKVANEMGQNPSYVLSDDGSNLKAAVRTLGWRRHRDIGHAIANMLEEIYDKDERFVEFKKALGSCKNLTLSEAAPFAPPKERAPVRWLNIYPSIEWAMWILDVYGLMDENVRKKFEELCSKHPGIVNELSIVTGCAKEIMTKLKTEGLSKKSIEGAKSILEGLPRYYRGSLILKEKINAYLDEEAALLEDENGCHPISSDIIESYFSVVKRTMPNAKYYGFTEYSLGMYTRVFLTSVDGLDRVDMLELMGATSMKDIGKWCESNLVDSAYDRKKAFKVKVAQSGDPKKPKKSA